MTRNGSHPSAGLPPPTLLKLVDAGRQTGWVTPTAIGFGGFADESEAAHAAWVAYRALARRHARLRKERPIPISSEEVAIQHTTGEDIVLAGGRPIAKLLRPAADGNPSSDSFAFEIAIPAAESEFEARATAYLMYRSLRKSGIRWALWRKQDDRPRAEHRQPKLSAAPATKPRSKRRLERAASVGGIVAAGALVFTAPITVIVPIAVALVAGSALGLLASERFTLRDAHQTAR